MKIILCEYHMFDLHQQIKIIDTNGEVSIAAFSTLQALPQDIVDVCVTNNIHNVHLVGNENYANDFIVPKIRENNALNYANFNINVEVN